MKKIYSSGWPKLKLAFISFAILLLSDRLTAQTKYTITGKVNDATTKEPLPGVVVKLQGTAYAAATNNDGVFSFSANVNLGKYQVSITYIGYKPVVKSISLGDAANYTVNAEIEKDLVGLNEVIVTGTSAGTTRKQLGSYVSTVKADELTKGATGNVLAALQDKTAGAQITQNSGDPAGGISVRLRGISSISSSSEPLYIVDGIIVNNATNRVTNTESSYDGSNSVGTVGQNRLVDINPADIDHIEVLNGAAAAAIYGSRANAGVVQIFTKRGSTGAPEISFSTSITSSSLRKKLAVNEAPIKFGGSVNTQTQDLLTPTLTNTTPVTRYDYQDYIYRTAMGTDNNVSVSGGKDDTKYYTSLSYFSNQGIVKNTDFKRYSFRTNLDQKLTKWANLSAGISYTNSSADEKPDGNSFFSPTNAINIIGNFHDIFTRDALGALQAVGERGRVNPVSIIEDIKQREETNRVLGNVTLKLYPIKNLMIDNTFGVDNSSQNGTTYIPPFAYNVSPAFYGGGATLSTTTNGYASAGQNLNLQLNNELNATYQWQISDQLASTSQVGYSYQYQKTSYSVLQGQGLAPFIQTVNGASTILPSTDQRTQFWVSGEYLQQNFKYKDHFFITGAVRVDGSSVFGTNQRNQVYFKGSGSYVLSSADYWKNFGVSKWWNVFKLRAAFGQSGNLTGIGAYDRFNTYASQPFVGKTSFYSSTVLANENVKPERQNELEVGTDLSFFNNRFSVTYNWYDKKVNDLLFPRQIAPTNGFSSLLDNFGSLSNKGYEIVLNGTPLKSSSFTWNTTFIFNHNRNKAIGQPYTLLSTNAGAPVFILDGQPIGEFYGTFYARNADGSILTNAAGIPQIEKGVQNSALTYTPQRDASGLPTGTVLRKVIGNPNPDYTASFVNEFTYKKINLRIQLDDVHGGNVFNADYRTRQGVGNGLVAQAEDLGQLPRGYIAGIYPIEEFRIDNGSFVKLREVSLSYNLGKLSVFKSLTISASGRNLISWDKYKGYDPEGNAAGQSTLLRGIDFGNVPIPKTFSLGLQARF